MPNSTHSQTKQFAQALDNIPNYSTLAEAAHNALLSEFHAVSGLNAAAAGAAAKATAIGLMIDLSIRKFLEIETETGYPITTLMAIQNLQRSIEAGIKPNPLRNSNWK